MALRSFGRPSYALVEIITWRGVGSRKNDATSENQGAGALFKAKGYVLMIV